MVPFVAPKHRHAWPRRNQVGTVLCLVMVCVLSDTSAQRIDKRFQEQDGIGDGLSGAAAVDGEVLRQLLLSCASDAPVSPAEGAGLVPSTVALDVLKKAGSVHDHRHSSRVKHHSSRVKHHSSRVKRQICARTDVSGCGGGRVGLGRVRAFIGSNGLHL